MFVPLAGEFHSKLHVTVCVDADACEINAVKDIEVLSKFITAEVA